ncbi:MAG: LUD domain-containing protein [Ferrimonas sp.]
MSLVDALGDPPKHQAILNARRRQRQQQHRLQDRWDQWQQQATAVKQRSQMRLSQLLVQLEQRLQQQGVQVHWAKDGVEHNHQVVSLLQRHQCQSLVQGASRLLQECDLAAALTAQNISLSPSDMAGKLRQSGIDTSMNSAQIAQQLQAQRANSTDVTAKPAEPLMPCPVLLTKTLRYQIRQQLLHCEAVIVEAKWAAAEAGALVLCGNEGDQELALGIAPVQIFSLALDSVVANLTEVMALARVYGPNTTGQRWRTYHSIYRRPRPNTQMHLIIVDNGRSQALQHPNLSGLSQCIGCDACDLHCPVVVASTEFPSVHQTAPVSAALRHGMPLPLNLAHDKTQAANSSISGLCTGCGACEVVCPTQVPLLRAMGHWRHQHRFMPSPQWRHGMRLRTLCASPSRLRLAGQWARRLRRWLPNSALTLLFGHWGTSLAMQQPANLSVEQWFAQRQTNKGMS